MSDFDLVDVNEASRLTGLNQQTIYRLARQGRIRRFRLLRRTVRFSRTELMSLVAHADAQPSEESQRDPR
jgi:excisionase family DNA binding protein